MIIEFFDKTPLDPWNSNLLTAILAFLGVALSVYLSNRNNKKMAGRNENFQENLMNIQAEDQKRNEEKRQAFEEKIANKQIDADIKANAQIQWIQTTRNLSADFISQCFQVLSLVKIIQLDFSDTEISKSGVLSARMMMTPIEQDNAKKLKEQVDEIKIQKHWNVMEKGTTLALMFGPSEHEENDFIVYMIDSLREIFFSAGRVTDEFRLFLIEFLQDFSNLLRSYYKAEWKRASLQLEDEKAREYFIESDIYKEVKTKYWDYYSENIDLSLPEISSKGLNFNKKKPTTK